MFGGSTGSTDLSELAVTGTTSLLANTGDLTDWKSVVGSHAPRALTGAAMAAVDENIYVIGGLNSETGWHGEVHKFDSTHRTWTVLASKLPPADKLCATTVGTAIVVPNV